MIRYSIEMKQVWEKGSEGQWGDGKGDFLEENEDDSEVHLPDNPSVGSSISLGVYN